MSKNYYKLLEYDQAIIHSRIINVTQIDYITLLEIPHELNTYYSLYSVAEITSNSKADDLEFVGMIVKDSNHPWLQVKTSILNTEVGFHMYSFKFVNTITSDVVSVYFAYRIQDDYPDKSDYVYMVREEVDDSAGDILM